MRVSEAAYFANTLEAHTFIPSTGCVRNVHIAPDAKIDQTKLEHQHRACYSQGNRVTAKSEQCVVHIVHGLTGNALSFKAGTIVACTATATIDVDLLKAGSSILTAAIALDSGNAAYAIATGVIATAGLVAGDVLEVKITPKGSDVGDVDYIEEFLADVGDTLPDLWDVDAQTVNSTEDYIVDYPGGAYSLIHSNDAEAQAMQLSWDNDLLIDLFERPIIEWRAKFDLTGVNQLGSADQRVVIGICNDHTNAEDDLDAVTVNAWFRLEGADSKIYVETDDNTTNTDDQDSGVTIVDDTWTAFKIDFSNLSDVKFSIDGVEQSGAAMDMSAIVASTVVQPIVCIQRDAGVEEEKVYVEKFSYIQGRYLGTLGKGVFASLTVEEDAV